MARRRSVAVIAAMAAVVVVAGAASAAVVGFGGKDPAGTGKKHSTAATEKVTKQTLVDQQKESGTLGYGHESTLVNRLGGTVTWVADEGAVVHRGEALYRVDNSPVVVLYGALPAYRALSPGVQGADVKEFETELRALGYKGFTVDEKYDANTAAAVKKWQKALGLSKTGVVDLGRVVFTAGEIRVSTHKLDQGDAAAPGQDVVTTSGTARVVTVKLDLADQRLAKKENTVAVDMPDGKRVDGAISKSVTVIDTSGQAAKTKIEVTVSLADPNAATGYDQASVDVRFTLSERKDVLTVPVAALLALAEGGYGVEVVDGGQSRIVAVDTGLFAGGRVEVSGGGIAEGMTVVVPT